MLDWEITEAELAPPSEEENPPPRGSRRGFYVVIGSVVIVAIVVIAVTISWRFQEREVVIAGELLGQIRAEESARRFGDQDRIPDLIAPNIPRPWRDRYISQFVAPEGEVQPVGEITIESVEYNGSQADVRVRIGAQVQRRAYEQTPQGWRRVPLVINSDTFGTIEFWAKEGVELYKHESDTAFGEQIAADLPALWESVGLWEAGATYGRVNRKLPNFIRIQPEELTPPLLEVTEAFPLRVILNSPQVVSFPAEWNISAESAVRLALAEALWSSSPILGLDTDNLPHVNRLLNATRSVLTMRWALTDAEYTTLTTQWRDIATQAEWESPFFALKTSDLSTTDPFSPNAEGAALLIVANGIIEATGINTPEMAEIIPTLQNSRSWDVVFQTLVDQNTLAFEATLLATLPPPPLTTPFTATRYATDTIPVTNRGFAVTVSGHPSPIVIEGVGGAILELPTGERINPLCAPLFGELLINGAWRETGLRLEPTQLTVRNLTLPTTFTNIAPPVNTLAYLAGYNESNGRGMAGITNVSALTADGSLTPVLVPGDRNVTPFGGTAWGVTNSTTGMLFTIPTAAQGCDFQWYLRYTPGVGITGAWLVPQTQDTAYWLPRWDDVSGRGMIVEILRGNPISENAEMPFWWLDEGPPQLLGEPDGYLPTGNGYLLALNADSVMVYQIARPDTGRSAVAIIDTATLTERAVYEPPAPDYYAVDFAYSTDGDFLYLAWQVPRASDGGPEGTVLQQIELATGTVQEWLSQEQGTIYFIAPDVRAPHVYAMTLSEEDAAGVRLVKITEAGSTVFNNGGDAFGISLVLRCGVGGLLYLRLDTPTDQETRYELDPRYLHIVTPDESGAEQNQVFPLATSQLPLMCP